ncbi:hypothetical protein LCGC14_1066610 [marine sediment metagenome]|uniref:Exopolysaccharide biosynthesis polyprenyl glycosylphosphotransferase n=2 Tax=root TaxID=1 RepID=A0A831VMW3_9FLAO|nr:exopolysaccharide biosynthesis polyprenyl glycosylphosphotransferase [Pricia antarctica]
MLTQQNKDSAPIDLLPYILDLLVVNIFAYFLPKVLQHPITFHIYLSISWISIALLINFYEVYRYNKLAYIFRLLFVQFVFFSLVSFAFIGFFKQTNIGRLNIGYFLILVGLTISLIKLTRFIYVRNYRQNIKKDFKKVIVIGKNDKTKQLINVFGERTDFGYNFIKQFYPKDEGYQIADCFSYILKHEIDEVYCSIEELSDEDFYELINFGDKNFKTIKFIPDNKQIFSKKLNFEYLDYVPVLSLKENPLAIRFNPVLKRGFDIIFSTLVIMLVLSWLIPIIALFIKIESKGPIFFVQNRKGSDFQFFACYKFRSMAQNKNSDNQQASKNDMRITKVGKFIRKTSLDELPQFFNVFLGSMSVVGPRPLMIRHTEDYMDRIDKFMLRHHVKPGITGLAQVRGYRGEIEVDSDMINRVRLDIFYVENWSLFLDIRIIIQTMLNVVQGEEKAY